MEEESTAVLAAQRHERTPWRRGQRNGSYTRDLVTPAGVIADLHAPRDRAGRFQTQGFERDARRQGRVTELRSGMVIRDVAALLWEIFAQLSREAARERLAAFQARYEADFPEAVATLLRDVEACLTFYDFARATWTHIRTTNALEGLFSTIRRRTDKIGVFCGENSCVLFVFAVIQSVRFRMREAPPGRRNRAPSASSALPGSA